MLSVQSKKKNTQINVENGGKTPLKQIGRHKHVCAVILYYVTGTVFLWLFWPSFNSALVDGDDQHRAVINTYLSLTACCVTAFAVSSIVSEEKKFDMVSTVLRYICHLWGRQVNIKSKIKIW
jgi:ammonia channel protein AmtB